jgi:NAD(P)-dependent dehydrogenase (short-subunit alcohol dehydrogenase family)
MLVVTEQYGPVTGMVASGGRSSFVRPHWPGCVGNRRRKGSWALYSGGVGQAGFVALPTESVYCMTKAAIAHLTKCLAVEWGNYGITVNGVAPTFIHTPGTSAALSDPVFESDVTDRIAALHRVTESASR